MACDVRGVLILHEDVATVLAGVSSARKKTELLFFLAEMVRGVGRFVDGLGPDVGWTAGLLMDGPVGCCGC
jgi:hypothetical protein